MPGGNFAVELHTSLSESDPLMTEIVKNCPICGSSTSSPFDQREFRGQLVTNLICERCGSVYQSPRMTESESQAFYEAKYRLLYQGQEGPNLKDLAVQAARAQVALDFVRKPIKSPSRILDIGCSTGILLQQFQDHYHCRVCGVEPGNEYRQYAQSSGLEVYSSLEKLQKVGMYRFNLVSMMHVLEHLPNPVEYLQNLRTEFLELDSWLLLEVPNLYAHDCFEVAHNISFSAHTLTQLVQKAGYRVVQLRAHGLPRSYLIPLYLTLLAQPDSNAPYSFKPDRQIRLKRRYGIIKRRLVEHLFPRRAWIPLSEI
jgi:2-polyprenyl-3-methyl-5-hydroxy-6-metoxy-1,4-benzoquinol methylase